MSVLTKPRSHAVDVSPAARPADLVRATLLLRRVRRRLERTPHLSVCDAIGAEWRADPTIRPRALAAAFEAALSAIDEVRDRNGRACLSPVARLDAIDIAARRLHRAIAERVG